MGKSKELAELGDVVTQSGGNVGVNTADPTSLGGGSKLTVNQANDGNIIFARGGSTRQVQLGTTSTTGYINADNTTNGLALHMNGTERMRIDASGRVTMPYQLHISGSPQNSVGYGVANTFYTYNTPVGLSFSNSRITVPVAGRYLLCWNTICDSGVGRVDTKILVNGLPDVRGMSDSDHTDFRYRGSSAVLLLQAYDYIQFEHQDYYASASTTFNDWNHASVTFLG